MKGICTTLLMVASAFLPCHGDVVPEDNAAHREVRPWGVIRESDLARLKKGDRLSVVLDKLGSPAPCEVSLPFLIYEAEDHPGKHFIVHFDLRRQRDLTNRSKISYVSLDSFADEVSESLIVWPEEKKTKKGEPGATDNPGNAQ